MLQINTISARSPSREGRNYGPKSHELFTSRQALEKYLRTIGKVDGVGKKPDLYFGSGEASQETGGMFHRDHKSGHLTLIIKYRYFSGNREQGYVFVPVDLNEAYRDLRTVHEKDGTEGTDFDVERTKIILPADRTFVNPMFVHEATIHDHLNESPAENFSYDVEIHVVNNFFGEQLEDIRRGVQSGKKLREGRLVLDTGTPLNVDGFQVPTRVLKWHVSGYPSFWDAVSDGQRFFDNFMDWYTEDVDPSRNSAIRWIDETRERRTRFYVEDAEKTQATIRATKFGKASHSLAPWTVFRGSFVNKETGMPVYVWYSGEFMEISDKTLLDFEKASEKIEEIRKAKKI